MAASHDQFGGVRQCHTRAWPWRPSSSPGGPLRGRLRRLGCAVWLRHAATVTSYVRMRSSSGRWAPVPSPWPATRLTRAGAVPPAQVQSPPGSAGPAEQWPYSPAELHNGMQCGAVGRKFDASLLTARRRHLITHGTICVQLRSFR